MYTQTINKRLRYRQYILLYKINNDFTVLKDFNYIKTLIQIKMNIQIMNYDFFFLLQITLKTLIQIKMNIQMMNYVQQI